MYIIYMICILYIFYIIIIIYIILHNIDNTNSNVILDDSRKLLKDITNKEFIITFYNISFKECMDFIIQNKMAGK